MDAPPLAVCSVVLWGGTLARLMREEDEAAEEIPSGLQVADRGTGSAAVFNSVRIAMRCFPKVNVERGVGREDRPHSVTVQPVVGARFPVGGFQLEPPQVWGREGRDAQQQSVESNQIIQLQQVQLTQGGQAGQCLDQGLMHILEIAKGQVL